MTQELIEKLQALKQSTGNIEDDHSFNRGIKAAIQIVRAHHAEQWPNNLDGTPMTVKQRADLLRGIKRLEPWNLTKVSP